MIVIARSHGQLGNQLFLFAHVLAFGMEAGVPVANPAFGAYGEQFPAFAGDALCRVPQRSRLPFPRRYVAALASRGLPVAARLPGVDMLAVADGESADLDAQLERARGARLLLLAGWDLRAPVALVRHRAKVLEILTPHPAAVSEGRDAAGRARGSGPLIGLHVRRGDYAAYEGGRLHYGLDAYRAAAQRALDEQGPGATLLVCSDGPLPDELLAGLPATPGPGSVLGDLCALAACDTLIGPPSTFTMWASLSGGIPLAMLRATDAGVVAGPPRVIDG